MKKLIILSIILSLHCINHFGQGFRFGVVANPSYSWFKSDMTEIKEDGGFVGYNIGILADRYFAEHYAFSTGLTIRGIGGVIQYNDEKTLRTSGENYLLSPYSRVHYKLRYLHIPLALKFKSVEIGYTSIYVNMGLDAMVNIKAKARVDALDIDVTDSNVNKEINLFYMGYHFEGGVEYKIVGNTAILFGISYMNGITDVLTGGEQNALLHAAELKIGLLF
jgi:hypothetical protein